MFEPGNIVYHDNLIFNDSIKDNKEKRPCIVLFSIYRNNQAHVCTCPLTSQVKTFNKHPRKYLFIPEVIYNYKKLSFVKLEDIRFYKEEETHDTGLRVDNETLSILASKIKNYNPKKNKRLREVLNIVKEVYEYIGLFDIIEEREIKKQNKILKNEKRRMAKRLH